MLLSVAIIAVLAGIGAPIYQSFQNRNDLDIAAQTLVQGARRAQVLAQAVDGDSSWGVYVATSTVVIFQGDSYATRSSSFDEVLPISGSILVSGASDYVFSKLEGIVASNATTTFTSVNNEVRAVGITSKGLVDY